MGEHVNRAGQVRPADVRQLTRTDLETFTVAERVAAVLGDDGDTLLRAVLTDLFDTAHEVPTAAGSADRITTELLDELHEFDQAARRLRRRIDHAEDRRVRLHRAVAERAQRQRRAADEAAAERAQVEARRSAYRARVEAARRFAADESLTLDRQHRGDDDGDGDRYRLIADTAAHRLLPHRFDDPAGWQALDVMVRGGRRWFVLPGSAGSLAHVEAWLAHRCGYTPPDVAAVS